MQTNWMKSVAIVGIAAQVGCGLVKLSVNGGGAPVNRSESGLHRGGGGGGDAPIERSDSGLHRGGGQPTKREAMAICGVDRQTPGTGLIAAVACDLHEDTYGRVATTAIRHMDAGGEKSVLAPAAFVAACGGLFTMKKTRRDPAYVDYVTYRMCRLEQAKVDDKALAAALDAAKQDDKVKQLVLDRYHAGVARLDEVTDLVAEHETTWPTDKAMFDETVKQVNQKYMPIFDRWTSTFQAIEDWYQKIPEGGPSVIEGCAAKYQKLLAKYVATVAPKAKGNALLEALKDPVGFHLSEALAVCYMEVEDPIHARAFASWYLKGGKRVEGWHEALWDAIAANTAGAHYDGKKLSNWVGSGHRLDAVAPDQAWHALDSYTANTSEEEDTVAAVKKQGDHVEITWKTKTSKEREAYDCVTDYGHVSSVDEYGKFHYDEHCKYEMVTEHSTRRPLLVLAADATRVKPGTTVAVIYGSDTKGEHTVLWVKQGDDVVWAAGITLR